MQRKEVEAVLFFSFALIFLALTLGYFFYWQANAHDCYCRTNTTVYTMITPRTCEDICSSIGAEVTDKNYTDSFFNLSGGLL